MPERFKIEARHCGGAFNLSAGERFVKEEECVWSENMEFSPEGSAVTSLGWASPTSWVWDETGHGIDGVGASQQFPDVFFAAVNGKIKAVDTSTGTPYECDTGVALTAGEPVIFKEYRGKMFYCNGVDNTGAIAMGRLKTAITEASTYMTLEDGYEYWFNNGVDKVYAEGDEIDYTGTSVPAATFTATHGTDTFNATAHKLFNGDVVRLTTTGVLPAGLMPFSPPVVLDYWVINKTNDTFQLSLNSGGAAIEISDNGTGTHTFTPINTSRFTGVTNIAASDHAIGTLLTQNTQLFPPPTGTLKAKSIVFWRDTMWMTGLKGEPNLLRYSKTVSSLSTLDNVEDFSDGENYMIGEGGEITALQPTRDRLYAFMRDRVHYITIEIASDGSEVFSPDRLFTGNYGCPNQFCTEEMEDVVVFFTGRRVIRIGYSPNADQILPDEKFDEEIYPILQSCDADQSKARVVYYPRKKELHVTFQIDGSLRTAKYNYRTDKWSYPGNYDASCYAVYQDGLYFGDPDADVVYKMNSSIDMPDGALSHIYKTGRLDKGTRLPKMFLKGFIEGKKTRGFDLHLVTVVNGKDVGGTRSINDEHTDSEASPISLGDVAAGLETVGGGIGETSLYYYKYPFIIRQQGEDIQLRFSSYVDSESAPEDGGALWTIDKWNVEGIVLDQNISTSF